MIENVARYPERFKVRNGPTRSEMTPAADRIIADHLSQLMCNFSFEAGRDGGNFAGDVVRVVEHGREIGSLARDRLLRQHVSVISSAEERNASAKLLKERRKPGSKLCPLIV